MPPNRSVDEESLLDRVAAPAGSALPLPRLLVVLAHPDDETLALGGRVERLAASRILTVTDGTPPDGKDARQHGFPSLEAYREARRNELRCALRHAGLPESILWPTGSGTGLPMADQNAALQLPALTRAVAEAIALFAPEAVLTHPYEGGHPDHDACAFAVGTALRLLAASSRAAGEPETLRPIVPPIVPPIVEAPFYHARSGGAIETGCFLSPSSACAGYAMRVCELSSQEQTNKRARLACFGSQAETLAQFGTGREMFRIAPTYDFTVPPHPGPLFYEKFPWGMSGAHFCSLAVNALQELRLSPLADALTSGYGLTA